MIINAPISVKAVSWNYNGSILAVAGYQMRADDKEISVAQFYNPMGKVCVHVHVHVYSLYWSLLFNDVHACTIHSYMYISLLYEITF